MVTNLESGGLKKRYVVIGELKHIPPDTGSVVPSISSCCESQKGFATHDNALIERFFSHLKVEALYPYDIRSSMRHKEE